MSRDQEEGIRKDQYIIKVEIKIQKHSIKN